MRRLLEFLKGIPFFWRVLGCMSRLSCRRVVRGKRNHIAASMCFMRGVTFDIGGSNNRIEIGKETVLRGVVFRIRGSGHRVRIGERCRFTRGSEIWIEDENTDLEFGDGTSVERGHFAVTEKDSKMTFGCDCMLATDVEVRTGDSHSIFDIETGVRINSARDVRVGDHVWIGSNVTLLKGVTVGDGSIIASGAVVTKYVASGCIAGGNPARIIREGVSWNRKRLHLESADLKEKGPLS